jgi:hypothetical protein
LRLLQGWDDDSIHAPPDETVESNSLRLLESKDRPLFKKFCRQVINKSVDKTMQEMYSDLDLTMAKRIRATLFKNFNKIAIQDLASLLKDDFLQHEEFLNSIQTYIENRLPTV